MGRRANWPPKVTLHKASGTERVRYKGQDHPLGKAGSAEARRAYAALLQRLVAEGQGPENTELRNFVTLGQACQLWRVEALARYGEGNHELSEHDSAWGYVLALFRDLPVSRFGAAELEEARDAMAAAGLCRGVINRRVVRIRTGWRWLERKRHAPPGSWAALCALGGLRAGDRRAKERPPVEPAEWAVVEATCRRLRPVPRAMVLAQWWVGCRPSELFGLTCGQLRGAAPLVVPLGKHKTAAKGRARALVFGPRALGAVAPVIEGRPDDALAFPNRLGRPYNRTSYYTAVSRAGARAGVKLYPYALRHGARRRVGRELGIEHAKALLGHAHSSMTERYASSQDVQLAVEAARKCG
jgi:integrase